MTSLSLYQACSPVEDLQSFQGNHFSAHRARRSKTMSWRVGSWSMRLKVDTEGSREIASQAQRGEEKKDRLDSERTRKVQCDGCSPTRNEMVRKQFVSG